MGQGMTDLAFGSFRLKRQQRLLSGPDGPVELSARAFDLLVVLLDHPGEVVSKDALFAAVWSGVVVEENTLQVHVSSPSWSSRSKYPIRPSGSGSTPFLWQAMWRRRRLRISFWVSTTMTS